LRRDVEAQNRFARAHGQRQARSAAALHVVQRVLGHRLLRPALSLQQLSALRETQILLHVVSGHLRIFVHEALSPCKLLDAPLLGSSNGNDVMQLLTDLNEKGTTVIMVTHSEHDARYSHRIIRMLDGQAVIENLML
jgi:predicted ABC-type transport system involved in lysophospholipase L1 biosynthesis ATPase subunit